ncbi:MAG TPA: class I SAM-dependent methyltransferase [Trebonia sp.]|nr:class I SAM-dependent methyltransferase [Trebonia sp.]
MSDEIRFARDLYRGTAGYYDRYRLSYPPELITDLLGRTAPSGHGRLLDLACGTGQLAFALRDRFAEVWAVDQEPDMVEAVAAKATALGDGPRVRPVVAAAEDLQADPDSFELAVIGNAFHRLRRAPVARLLLGWLQPGGFLALCSSTGLWTGSEDWQLAFAGLLQRWRELLSAGRIPANWDQPQRELPDADLLAGAGFETMGHFEFGVPHEWTVPELAGYVRSTSFLPPSVLGDHSAAFDAELADTLSPYEGLTETVSYVYDLARKPLAPT